MGAPSQPSGDGDARTPPRHETGPRGLWTLLAATLVFLAFAPIGVVAAPTAALLARSKPRRIGEFAALAITAGLSIGWLLTVGSLPDQVLRACVMVSTTVFALTAVGMPAVPHRALLAIGSAAMFVAAMFPVFGITWDELHWWVEHGAAQSARAFLAVLWMTAPTTPDGALDPASSSSLASRAEAWLADSGQFMADYYPAIVAIQLCTGMALATAVYCRVTDHPVGDGLGRLRDFRFSEHIGWIAIVPLVIVLVPVSATAKLIAVNTLLVMAAFYAVRGAGVVVYAVSHMEGSRGVAIVMGLIAAVLLLPIFVAGIILVGVADARLDLRARWPTDRLSTH